MQKELLRLRKGLLISLLPVCLITAVCILPVLVVNVPAMNDYPGHLARMFLLTSMGTENQNPYYYYYLPYVYPNLAMDIVVPFLGRFLDVPAATKVFLIFTQILLVGGAAALEIVVKRRHEFGGFAAAAVLYCLPFAWGFLNFEFGTGVALCGLASWFALEQKEAVTRIFVHGLFCAVLFVSHLVAFGLYGVTLAFYWLWGMAHTSTNLQKKISDLIILTVPALIILIYFFSNVAEVTNSGGESHKQLFEWGADIKVLSLLHGMNGYNAYLSIGIILVLLLGAAFMFTERWFRVLPQGRWISLGLLILILVLPFSVLGGDYLNLRIAIGGLLILPAFLVISREAQFAQLIPPLILSSVAIINCGHIAVRWFAYQPSYFALEKSFKQIRWGALVLVGHANFKNDRFDKNKMPVMSATSLAVHYANAFVPTLVTIPGQQPLRVCPELRRLALVHVADYWPVGYSTLAEVKKEDVPDAPKYVRDWLHDYDYLYLVGPPGPNPMPDHLVELSVDNNFTLYRIVKAQGEGNALGAIGSSHGVVSDDSPCKPADTGRGK